MSEVAASDRVRVLIVEDEPLMPEAIRDGLRLEGIAADIASDGDTALELLDDKASGSGLGADDYLTKPAKGHL
jgi:DNA-binding response OmpR family regulator